MFTLLTGLEKLAIVSFAIQILLSNENFDFFSILIWGIFLQWCELVNFQFNGESDYWEMNFVVIIEAVEDLESKLE